MVSTKPPLRKKVYAVAILVSLSKYKSKKLLNNCLIKAFKWFLDWRKQPNAAIYKSPCVQTRDATTISRDCAVNRSFLKNSVCRDSFMYLFILSLIRKQYSVKFYFWMTTVYENKFIKKRTCLGSLGLKSNRLSQAGPIQTREGKTANFRWLFCLWIEKLCPLSLATSYSISEDCVLAFLIHLPALMFAFWRKRNFTFLVLVLLKSCHVGGH